MKKPPLLLVSFGVLVALLVWYWQRRQHKLPYLEPSIPATSAQRTLSSEEPATSERAERQKQAVKMPEILPSERNRPVPMPQPGQQLNVVPMPSVDPSRDGSVQMVAFNSSVEQSAEPSSSAAEATSDEQTTDQQQVEQTTAEQQTEQAAAEREDEQQTEPQSETLTAEREAELLQQAQEQREAALASAQDDQSTPIKRLNPNTASLQELIDLPGIGPVLAKRIIEYRDTHGAFKTIDDLVAIQGIGPNNIRQFDFLLSIDEEEADQ